MGERYTVPQKELRRAMHAFFDKVIYQLWGERGVASTRIAYVSKIDGHVAAREVIAKSMRAYDEKFGE